MPSYADPTIVQLDDKPRIAPAAHIMLAAGVLSILGAASFFVMTVITQNKTKEVQDKITATQTKLAALKPTADELVQFDRRANNLLLLFDTQKEWHFVFNHIENSLYKNMTINRLSVDDKAKFTLGGTTSSYVDYAKIYQSFTDPIGQGFFASVKPASVTRATNPDGSVKNVQFTFDLMLQPATLNAKKNYVPPAKP